MFIRIRLIPITIVFVILMLVFRIGSVWDGIDPTQTAKAIPAVPEIGQDARPLLTQDSLADQSELGNGQQPTVQLAQNKEGGLSSLISDVHAQDVADTEAASETTESSETAPQKLVNFADIPARQDDSTRGLTPMTLIDEEINDQSIIDTNSLSVAEVRLLHTLADRRRQLESRERSLTERESVLVAAERQLIVQQGELEAIREEIRKDLSVYDQAQERQIVQMREVYATMKPKKAALIFNDLDLDILINVLRGMVPRKVAPIIAGMEVEKARKVTLSLADRNSYQIPE